MLDKNREQEIYLELSEAINNCYKNNSIQNAEKVRQLINKSSILGDYDNKDIKCIKFVFNPNVDKPFFGITVIPITDNIENFMLTPDESYTLKGYKVEIDGKLFDQYCFNSYDVTLIMIHEIYGAICDSSVPDVIKDAINVYLADVDECNLNPKSIEYNKELFEVGIEDAIRKVNSLFFKDMANVTEVHDDYICDVLDECERFKRVTDRIIKARSFLDKRYLGRFAILSWVLKIYKSMKYIRMDALDTLFNSLRYEPSKLIIGQINKMIHALKYVKKGDGKSYLNESVVSEGFKDFISSIGSKNKYNAYKTLEDELYEYTLKVKNVELDDEALYLLREINTRISLISEYVMNYADATTDKDKLMLKNYKELLDKYCKLRSDLAKKTTYKEKYLGLFVDTPVVKSRYEV